MTSTANYRTMCQITQTQLKTVDIVVRSRGRLISIHSYVKISGRATASLLFHKSILAKQCAITQRYTEITANTAPIIKVSINRILFQRGEEPMQLTGRPAGRLSHILWQWLSIGMRLNSALRLDSVKVSMPAVWPASLIRQAVVRRALLLLLQLGARRAAVGGFEQDVTGAMAQAAPRARPQTQAPGRPHRHLAVQRRFCKTCRSHEDR